MHPDLPVRVLYRSFSSTPEKFLRGEFFLLFISFRVAFYFLILVIGFQKESDRAGSLAFPIPRLKSHSWQA